MDAVADTAAAVAAVAAVAHVAVAVVAAAVGAPALAGAAVVEAAAAVQASGSGGAWVAAVDAGAVGYGPRVSAAGSGPVDSGIIKAQKRGGLRFEPALLALDLSQSWVASREVETPAPFCRQAARSDRLDWIRSAEV